MRKQKLLGLNSSQIFFGFSLLFRNGLYLFRFSTVKRECLEERTAFAFLLHQVDEVQVLNPYPGILISQLFWSCFLSFFLGKQRRISCKWSYLSYANEICLCAAYISQLRRNLCVRFSRPSGLFFHFFGAHTRLIYD